MVTATSLRTNHDRLMRSLEEVSAIGRLDDRSIDRRAFNEADMAARRWLVETCRERGLRAELDAAGNVRAWGPDASSPMQDSSRRPDDPGPRPLLIGSHLDSVPQGGTLDGTLGVMIGLEVLTCLREVGELPRKPAELVVPVRIVPG